MGIFNEHSHNNRFARGLQGAPGVGFNLTSDGNYDMSGKKLTNVGKPTVNTDAATKKYVDDNFSGQPKTSLLKVDSNIDMKDQFHILNLKTPTNAKEPATKQYVDSNFLYIDGTNKMTGILDMNGKKIKNLPNPMDDDEALNVITANKKFLHLDGTRAMQNHLNMNDNPLINLKATPINAQDATSKNYVDENFYKRDGTNTLTGDLNINGQRVKNLISPSENSEAATKKYVDDNKVDGSVFLKLDGSRKMTGNLDMNGKKVLSLSSPSEPYQPTTLAFCENAYLKRDGSNAVNNNLNMENKKIYNLRTPTSDTDAATKKYIDDKISINGGALANYLKKDGSIALTGDLNLNSNKIVNLSTPTSDTDATNKDYVDHLNHEGNIQPSHYKNQFGYLMSSAAQWTDEIDSGNSFNITRIGDLLPNKRNFHDYNHKVLFTTIIKNSQGGYKYKMGINFYRLKANVDYTLCLEILNTDYQLWHKSKISVDGINSTGLTIGNVGVRKLSHSFNDSKGQIQYMYYHRIIVNFRKLSSGNKFLLHILVNIPQDGTDLAVYPRQFSGVYIIAYGIIGTTSNIDPDKTYDYHTAFDIKPTQVVYNVDINANNKKILIIALDRNSNNSAATVAMVKELIPFTTNILYRKYFEEYYDFTDANFYGLSRTSSGIVFNSLDSINGNPTINVGIPNRTIDDIRKDGLNVKGYTISFSPPPHKSKYTLCIVFYHWRNKNFTIYKKNSANKTVLLHLYYLKINNSVNLVVNNIRRSFSMLSSFKGKKIVLWLTEDFSANVTKANISDYNSTLTIPTVNYTNEQEFEFTTQDGVLSKLMYSPNIYDTDSEQFHKVMLQEKLSGSYVT